MGLINDPIMKNMYWAYKGGGAYRNGKKIFVSKNTTFENTYLNTGGSGRYVGFSYSPLLELLSKKKCAVTKYPSSIYGGIQVANGKYVGAVCYSKEGHDVAALKIITEEAGGKVTDLNGEDRRYDGPGIGCVVSNGVLHDELIEIIKEGKLI